MARLQQKKSTAPKQAVPVAVVQAARPTTPKPSFKLKPVKIPASEIKFLGTSEPPVPTDHVLSETEMARFYNWYNYVCDKSEAREWTEQLISAYPKRKHLVARYKKIPDWRISSTLGWISRIVMRGGHVPYRTLRFMVKQLKEAEIMLKKHQEQEAKDKPVEAKPVNTITIQDRMREKLSECLGEAEGMIDEFRANGYKGDVKVFQLFKQFNVHQNQVNDIVSWAQPQLDEMLELQEVLDKKKRTDFEDQLVEGYSHMGKRQIKAVVEMWTSIIDAAKSYGSVKKAERAPRKRKPVPPEKMVKRLKFLRRDEATGLESIDPTKLVGASEVWVYNTKTRKVGLYVADDYSKVMMVKGAGLLGFSEKESKQKTLRKPETQLKEFLTMGKPAARKWFSGIKSTEIKLNGRTNEHTILLRAYK